MLEWLKSPDGIALLGALGYIAVSVLARYMPATPGWMAVRSFVTDYAQRNVNALPPSLEARIDPVTAEIVLLVSGTEVKRYPMVRGGAK